MDAKNGEKYKLIPYRKVTSFVPDWIKGQVLEDNRTFMLDKHVFQDNFFAVLKAAFRRSV